MLRYGYLLAAIVVLMEFTEDSSVRNSIHSVDCASRINPIHRIVTTIVALNKMHSDRHHEVSDTNSVTSVAVIDSAFDCWSGGIHGECTRCH